MSYTREFWKVYDDGILPSNVATWQTSVPFFFAAIVLFCRLPPTSSALVITIGTGTGRCSVDSRHESAKAVPTSSGNAQFFFVSRAASDVQNTTRKYSGDTDGSYRTGGKLKDFF